MSDITERLRKWASSVTAVPATDLMDEAADEIERLRHRVRFADAVIRSGNVATITDAERVAVRKAADAYAMNDDDAECAEIAATLRGLLERMK